MITIKKRKITEIMIKTIKTKIIKIIKSQLSNQNIKRKQKMHKKLVIDHHHKKLKLLEEKISKNQKMKDLLLLENQKLKQEIKKNIMNINMVDIILINNKEIKIIITIKKIDHKTNININISVFKIIILYFLNLFFFKNF